MGTPKKKTAIAKKQPTELALASQYEENAGAGFEEADRDAFAIPFLAVLQSNSPQCSKAEGEYIKGAEQGFLFNSVSQEVFDPEDQNVEIIPCHYSRSFIEWKARGDGGGGLVAIHNVADGIELMKQTTKDDKNKDALPNGNILVDTRQHFCLLVVNGEATPVVISMSSTQMKKSKKWMTVMQNIKMARPNGTTFTPPMFAYHYTVETVPESNDQGSWFGWKITIGELVVENELFEQAKAFRDAVVAGEAKAVPPEGEESEEREHF